MTQDATKKPAPAPAPEMERAYAGAIAARDIEEIERLNDIAARGGRTEDKRG
jgi:hypothetical protein